MRRLALILLIMIALCATTVYGATGKLAGKVTEKGVSGGLGYVNVALFQNGKLVTGGQTKDNGTYMIINIPPGVYNVKYSMVSYAAVTVNGVVINQDQTTTQNVTMQKQSVEMKEIRVQATVEKVKKDQTSSSKKVNIGDNVTTGVQDVTDLMTGIAGVSLSGGELHVRGGRPNEVNYTIDGLSVSDPVSGGSPLQVDPDAISDMQVMTGGFTAEYGNAQSGVVTIVTKEGDAFYSGKVEYQTDHAFAQNRNDDTFKFAIGGPLFPWAAQSIKEKLTFYLNGAGNWSDGRLAKYVSGDPNDFFTYTDPLTGERRDLLDSDYPKIDPFANRKSIPFLNWDNRLYNSYNVNLKSKYEINKQNKVTLALRGDRSVNDYFSYLWRFAPQHQGLDDTRQLQVVGNYDYVISPTMNLKLKGSYYQKNDNLGPKGIERNKYYHWDYGFNPIAPPADYINMAQRDEYGFSSIDAISDGVDDNYLPAYLWEYRIAGVEEPRAIEGFVAPGTIYTNFIKDKTASVNTRADFEWQLNSIHDMKTGLELTRYDINKNQLFNFLTVYETRRQAYLKDIYNIANYVDPNPADTIVYVPPELYGVVKVDSTYIPIYKPMDYYNATLAASGTRDGYKANPWQAAYYLQDKMEWEGMIVNAGLRFDFWYLGNKYYVLQDNGSYRNVPFKSKDRMQMMVSPRLGVSHPISDKDVLRFAYNYQNQLPPMQYIFTSKTPEDANQNSGITVGNPNLQPQITITYEVGLSHQISEDYVLDMTAYYKNLYNYVSTKKVKKPGEEQVTWYEFISEDYGSARGIDMQLEKSLSDFYSWSLAYSLAWAQGNNSDTVIQDENTNLREFPLDWDVRHNINASFTFRVAKNEEYIIPFTNFVLPFDDFSANLNWTIASGAPYTPVSAEGNNALDTNSKRKPYTQNATLHITKGITLPGKEGKNPPYIRLFMDVENLFKYPNVGGVFARTGSPYFDGADLSEPSGFTFAERQHIHNLAIQNPANINNLRAVTVGVSFNF